MCSPTACGSFAPARATSLGRECASVVVSDIAFDRAEGVAATITAGAGTAVAMHVDVTAPELVQRQGRFWSSST